MSQHGNRPEDAESSLPALVAQLRSRCEAITRFQGGHTYHAEEVGIFRDLASDAGLFLDEAPPELSTAPWDEGNEHQVWFQPESATYLKATWPDHFGMRVIHRLNEEPAASPIDYLERWMWHNRLFGDTVEFVGALDSCPGLRLIIRQPAIEGEPATEEEIDHFFTSTGWKRFDVEKEVAYFDPDLEVVISDTHRGNIIATDDGLLLPIDLRVQPLDGSLLDTVKKLTAQN
jgi:hypothetical protein